MQLKTCNHHAHKGQRQLSVDIFHKDKHTSSGLKSICKMCAREKAKKYRKEQYANPERRKEYNRRALDYWTNKMSQEQKMLYAARDRAKTADMEFSLTLEDIVIPDVCPILGIPLKSKQGLSKTDKIILGGRFNSPSIDRADNTKGYTKDNIRIISWRANHLKNTATFEELVKLGDYAKQLLKKDTQYVKEK